MRLTILLITCSLSYCLCSQTIEEVRTSFHSAVLDPEESKAFHEFVEDLKLSSPTLKAYKAVSEAMLARVVWNPFTKLSQVLKFGDLIEMAVLEDPENIEIRFLRLAIEYNLPKFLGMSDHLIEDRDVIVKNMGTIKTIGVDSAFGNYIIYFLRDTKLCTEEEIVEMESGLVKS